MEKSISTTTCIPSEAHILIRSSGIAVAGWHHIAKRFAVLPAVCGCCPGYDRPAVKEALVDTLGVNTEVGVAALVVEAGKFRIGVLSRLVSRGIMGKTCGLGNVGYLS